jgi:hypothetical protein
MQGERLAFSFVLYLKELTEGQRFELMFDIAFGKKCQYCEVKLAS